jgi:H+/Cl- antiporter ClcA
MSADAAPEGTTPGAGDAPAATPGVPQIAALASFGVVVGLLAGLAASLFIRVQAELTTLLWTDLPDALGYSTAPAWLVVAILVTGALIVYAALKLPGNGGHSPLRGLGVDIGPREIVSVVIAALGTLAFGAVLGPEAPLMAIGSACGALAFRDPTKPARTVMMLAGSMAAIGAIFGNPLITAILLLEIAVLAGARMANPAVLLTSLASLAAGYALQVGIADWSGLGAAELSIPGLPPYPSVQAVDIVVAIPLAVVAAAVAMGTRLAGLRVQRHAERRPLVTILAAAVIVALTALAVAEITDGGLDLVLFSGQDAMGQYLALTSAGTAVVVLAGKFIAYSVSLGSGFRGGPIFPAVAIGAILGTLASLLVDGTSVSALAATAIAASVAAVLRLPFVATMLAVLITSSAGGATTVTAVIGTIVGLLARLQAETKREGLAVATPPA